MKQHDLIIDNRSALKTHHKVTSVGLTLFFWIIIFYLWQPLISLVAWAFGFKVFYEHMIILGGFEGFVEMLANYSLVIAVLGGSLLLWAKVNNIRFKNKVRRGSRPEVDSNAISDYFNVNKAEREKWLRAKNLTISLTDNADVTCVINQE